MAIVVIPADIHEELAYPDKLASSDQLFSLQQLVDGPIELIAFKYHGKPADMIVNEEGLLKQLPVNVRATTMLYDGNHAARVAPVLVGTCVLLTGRHRLK